MHPPNTIWAIQGGDATGGGGAGPPPPPPPAIVPPSATPAESDRPDMSGLFSDLNKGTAITSGRTQNIIHFCLFLCLCFYVYSCFVGV